MQNKRIHFRSQVDLFRQRASHSTQIFAGLVVLRTSVTGAPASELNVAMHETVRMLSLHNTIVNGRACFCY